MSTPLPNQWQIKLKQVKGEIHIWISKMWIQVRSSKKSIFITRENNQLEHRVAKMDKIREINHKMNPQ